VTSIANTSGLPAAFPRRGAKKLLENDRVIVWSYRWTLGDATPMHFHDKDALVVYACSSRSRPPSAAATLAMNAPTSMDKAV
jgi:hypothetical protein